jgi:hypothetical protein
LIGQRQVQSLKPNKQMQNLKTMLLFCLISFLIVLADKNPCIIWKNSYAQITPETTFINNTILTIIIKSRQSSGWYGIGFSSSPLSFEDSIFIIGQHPNQFYILKNHTQPDLENKIFHFSTEQTFKNSIDGIYSFSFQMNSSLVVDKKFIFFANLETPVDSTNVSMIPRHSSQSDSIFFDLRNLLSDYPSCGASLNIPGRLMARHWIGFTIGVIFCALMCFAYVYFRNDQPLKSRFFAPISVVVCIQMNLFSEFLYGSFAYEKSTNFFCMITGFITYTTIQVSFILPTLMMVRYTILLQLHLHKREFVKNLRNLKRKTSSSALTNNSSASAMTMSFKRINSQFKATQQKPAVSKFISKLRQVLLVLQSHWVFIAAPFIWFFIFQFGQFIVIAASGFTCKSWTQPFMRYLHIFSLLISVSILIFCYLLDLILSIKNFVKCRWKRFFFEEDPFHYRVDMMLLILFLPPLICWAFVPLPSLFSGMVVDVLMFLGTLFGGGIALILTIFKKIIFFIKTRNVDNQRLKITTDMILDDEKLLEKYIEFSEFEWSSENVFFKMDVMEYKRKSEIKSKKNYASQIVENYLIPNVSPLEINVTAKSLNPTLKQIEEQDFTNHLFDKIEREVDVNLCDTLARFIVSSQYEQFLKENENVISKLGL